MSEVATKFHKSLGNVKDEDVLSGEIKLLQTLVRMCEDDIINYCVKEERAKEKIEKIWNELKPYKQEAQTARIFIDEHPLFEAICSASGVTHRKGQALFFARVDAKVKRKLAKRKNKKNDRE